MRKHFKIIVALIIPLALLLAAVAIYFNGYLQQYNYLTPALEVPGISVATDQDNDQIDDSQDIYQGALAQIDKVVKYEDGYYQGGYPPAEIGVCSDVVWSALKAAGYDLKALVDKDISQNGSAYPRVNGEPDPNIDFRRVINLKAFFDRQAQKLTTEVKPWDKDNLYQWQAGDIVIYDRLPGSGKMHIAVVSGHRRRDGVPNIIHNYCCGVKENDMLLVWPAKIVGHYRYP